MPLTRFSSDAPLQGKALLCTNHIRPLASPLPMYCGSLSGFLVFYDLFWACTALLKCSITSAKYVIFTLLGAISQSKTLNFWYFFQPPSCHCHQNNSFRTVFDGANKNTGITRCFFNLIVICAIRLVALPQFAIPGDPPTRHRP